MLPNPRLTYYRWYRLLEIDFSSPSMWYRSDKFIFSLQINDGIMFEDTKGVIRIRISKKNRQHNGQKKTDKRTNNDL